MAFYNLDDPDDYDSWDGSVDPQEFYEDLYGERDRPFKKKKNTKKWCKGKVGREHKPVVEMNNKYGRRQCGPSRWIGANRWLCFHHVVCKNCKKELRFVPKVCPDNRTDRKQLWG